MHQTSLILLKKILSHCLSDYVACSRVDCRNVNKLFNDDPLLFISSRSTIEMHLVKLLNAFELIVDNMLRFFFVLTAEVMLDT